MAARDNYPALTDELEHGDINMQAADEGRRALDELDQLRARLAVAEADADRLADLLHDIVWGEAAADALARHVVAVEGRGR